VCARCVQTGRCDPFERAIERQERRGHEVKAWGLAR
jgi:hypothetical protein